MKFITTLTTLALASLVLFSASVSAGFAPLEVFAVAAGMFTSLVAFADYGRARRSLIPAARVANASAERLPLAA